jgi:hypothetical protein
MKTFFVTLFIGAVFITACTAIGEEVKSQGQTQPMIIKGGFSFGECNKNCKATVVVANNKVTYSSLKNGANAPLKECSENIAPAVVAGLTASVNFDVFLNLPATIGCPDCNDGGAEWIELSMGSSAHKVTFEYGKPPMELQAISLFFHTQFSNFKNCQ